MMVNNYVLLVKGGRGSNGGSNGDLFVEIRSKKQYTLIREGRNIYVTIPISSVDATLGCEVDVPTVQGDVKLKFLQEHNLEQL